MMGEGGLARFKKLRWMCRRGMRELEIMLEAFLAQEEGALVDGAWPGFEALLVCEDDQLWDWLQSRPCPETHQDLITAIRGGA